MAKTDNNYRIRTNIGSNTVLKVPLKRDIDFLEILSLKISQKGLYKLHASNYGVVVGRVLANDGFGIPNARISVFVELSEEDAADSDITQFYPYTSISSRDKEHRRYNILPDSSSNDCYRIVGTFPNKRMVLDNNTQVEIFGKYWKYTTLTNASGDYMIFGVPVGVQTIHLDIDLSNIGIMSQKPRDFMYKGYNITSFDNANQFKESTNLENLVQIIGQNHTVNVYPFWGDEQASGEVAITRQDINVAYKFEPTCVFMGSIASDNNTNSLGHECTPTKNMGYNSGLVASEGTIEMIRKTPDGLVEEIQIQGNQLIDGDGVWCYQIPMNLDYVVTDEFGNIVPTDNPNKGIPTRTSVRFRFSVNETGDEGISRHRAKYLVPNNPMPTNKIDSNTSAKIVKPRIKNWNSFKKNYEFGSATPDECFRDLYWNKVYSVKNYIPRLQSTKSINTARYTGIRTTNYHESISPFPFNNVRFNFPASHSFLCIMMEIFFVVVAFINATVISPLRIVVIGIPGLKIGKIKLYWYPFENILKCIEMEIEDDEAGDGSVIKYAPGCWGKPPKGARIGRMGSYTDRMQRGLGQEAEVVNFDFYNDWINGCLYMPLWFWKKTKKKKYFFGLFSKRAVNKFCNADAKVKNLRLTQGCAVKVLDADGLAKNVHKKHSQIKLPYGVINETTNKAGLKIYYYCPASTPDKIDNKGDDEVLFVRLFATDIILLGSLADCDLDAVPKMFERLPATTSNIPFMVSTKIAANDDDESEKVVDGSQLSVTGMDWTRMDGKSPKKYAKGLLLGLKCASATTYHKSIINTRRLCELGVTLDGAYDQILTRNNGTIQYKEMEPDGMITRIELDDLEGRAMFATLNHNGLDKETFSPVTKYNTYKFQYMYPVDFDGELRDACRSYTANHTLDNLSESYVAYRFGNTNYIRWAYNDTFSMYNNSFYFYFGINPGKTALEKFYTNFYATCFNNVKEPFTFDVSGTPGSWCKQDANAIISLSRIRSPYKMEVIDSLGIPFVSIDGLTYTDIEINFWDGNTIDGFTTEQIEEGKNLGYVYREVDNKYDVHSQGLTNGMYTVKITDAYNRTIIKELSLMQSSLSLEISSSNLSGEYSVGHFVDEDSSGKITIQSISIDGNDYRFKPNELDQVIRKEEGIFEIYGYKVISNSNGTYALDTEKPSNHIKLTITPRNSYNDSSVIDFDDTTYTPKPEFVEFKQETSYGSDFDAKTRMLEFKIRTADQFDISAIMLCDNALSDNEFETTLNIDNSMPMSLLIQGIDTDVIKTPTSKENAIVEWANIHNPKYYNFPSCETANQDWWNTYVDSLSDFEHSRSENGNILKVLNYKLNAILKVTNAVYCTSSQNFVEFSSNGGSEPKMYSVCPEYSAMTDANSKSMRLARYTYSDVNTTIQASGNYPTLINANYYTSPNEVKSSLNWGYRLNNLFSFTNNELGNYVGVIDANSKSKTKPVGIAALSNESIAEVQASINDEAVKNYFLSHTVDKRADYILYILKDVNSSNDYKNGKVLIEKGISTFFGGIALAYDESRNLVSKGNDTEYTYDETNYNGLTYNDSKNRKYYDISFRTNRAAKPIGFDKSSTLTAWEEDVNQSTNEFPVFKLTKDIVFERGNSLTWAQTSCSYNTDAAVVKDSSGKDVIQCEVYAGNEIDGTIGTNSYFTIPCQTMEAIVKQDYSNVSHQKNKYNKVDNVSFKFAISMDNDTSHVVYTNAPIFIKQDTTVAINDISSAYNAKAVKKTKVIIPEDYRETYTQMEDKSQKTKFIADSDSPKERLADDDEMRSIISYEISASKGDSGYPVVMREYIDSLFNMSRLARKVVVYEVGSYIHSYDTSDDCFTISIDSVVKNTWLDYCEINKSLPIPPMGYKKMKKKRISYILITLQGGSCTKNRGIDNPVDFIQKNQDTGQYMIGVKVDKNDIYLEAFPLMRDENKPPYEFIVPFYSSGDDSEDSEDEEDTETDDDIPYVSPVWYKKKNVYVYIKCINGLVYKYRRKF